MVVCRKSQIACFCPVVSSRSVLDEMVDWNFKHNWFLHKMYFFFFPNFFFDSYHSLQLAYSLSSDSYAWKNSSAFYFSLKKGKYIYIQLGLFRSGQVHLGSFRLGQVRIGWVSQVNQVSQVSQVSKLGKLGKVR